MNTSGSQTLAADRSWGTKLACLLMALLMLSVWGVKGNVPAASATTQTLDAPTNLSPSTGSAGPNPILTWDAVPGAAYYRVNFPTYNNSSVTETVYTTTFAPKVDFPASSVTWSVTAYDSLGNYSPPSSATFVNASSSGPVLSCPTSPVNYPAQSPSFTWAAVPDVKTYTLQVSTSSSFVPASTSTYQTQATSYTLSKGSSDNGQVYYAQVAGTTPGGLNTPVSNTCQYKVVWSSGTTGINDATPTLLSPSNLSTVRDVVLKWAPLGGAARYEVQVSSNGDWTNNLLYDVVVDSTTWAPAKTLNNGSYYWRLRGIDNEGNDSQWSDTPTAAWEFNVTPLAAPTRVSPTNGTVVANHDFKLSWAPVPGAGAYEVQVSSNSSFSGVDTAQSCYTTHTDWSPYTYGASPSTYGPGNSGGCSMNTIHQAGLTDAQTIYWQRPSGRRLHAGRVHGPVDQVAAELPDEQPTEQLRLRQHLVVDRHLCLQLVRADPHGPGERRNGDGPDDVVDAGGGRRVLPGLDVGHPMGVGQHEPRLHHTDVDERDGHRQDVLDALHAVVGSDAPRDRPRPVPVQHLVDGAVGRPRRPRQRHPVLALVHLEWLHRGRHIRVGNHTDVAFAG